MSVAATSPNLSTKQLRAVQTVARYSSFIAASVEMRMSQPGISRLIRSVEKELGVELFHRSTRQVLLTSEGLQFLPIVDRILSDFDLAADVLTSMQNAQRGHVIMACPVSIANRLLADIVSEYRRQQPHVILEIREGLRSAVIDQLRFGIVDFALASFMEPDDDLVIEPLCEVSYHVVFRPDHRFSAQESVSLAELRGEPMISLPPTSILRRIFDGAAAREGFGLNHVITVNSPSSIFGLVENGEGISIHNGACIVPRANESFSTRPIYPPRITSRIASVRLKSRPMSPAAQVFKSVVEDFFRQNHGI